MAFHKSKCGVIGRMKKHRVIYLPYLHEYAISNLEFAKILLCLDAGSQKMFTRYFDRDLSLSKSNPQLKETFYPYSIIQILINNGSVSVHLLVRWSVGNGRRKRSLRPPLPVRCVRMINHFQSDQLSQSC